jgi:hypothetical protein
MTTKTFRDLILRNAVGWQLGAPATRPGAIDYLGSRFLYSFAIMSDILGDDLVAGIRKRFPTYIEPGSSAPASDALSYIGRDRTIPQGPSEPNASYALRLSRWIDDWKLSGNAFVLLDQLAAYFTPQTTTLRLVNNWGIWYTRNPDGSRSLVQSPLVVGVGNWNWDNKGPWQANPGPLFAWSRFWVIIYCNGGVPFDVGPRWGDVGAVYSSSRTWGSTATPDQVAAIRSIVLTWKAAHSWCQNIILAFDPASFNPAGANGAPLPDGTWGAWSKTTAVPAPAARLATARYWKGN